MNTKTWLCIVFSSGVAMNANALTNFDESDFMTNGPFQYGTVKLDRTKTQSVVSWCTPNLLKMEVLSGVNNIPLDHVKTNYGPLPKKDGAHPEQVTVTIYPQTLPFAFANNYNEPQFVTSTCNPSSIQTTLQSAPNGLATLKHSQDISKPLMITPEQTTIVQLDCSKKIIGYHYGAFKGPVFGDVGGIAMLPKGNKPIKIQGECDSNGGFSIKIE